MPVIDLEIRVPTGGDWAHAERAVEAVCDAQGLTVSLKATLVRYPGSIHWHVRHPDEPGTLEITLWESAHRIWFSARPGRAVPWTDTAAPRLQSALEAQLHGASVDQRAVSG